MTPEESHVYRKELKNRNRPQRGRTIDKLPTMIDV